jgi:endonuclease/exonuclease/phosphatase family metal-dependent hydrolase
MPELVVASFNVHGGIDGWGRPTDVVDESRRLDADVLVLQEAFTGLDGRGIVDDVATATGLSVASHVQLGRVDLYPVHPGADRRWRPTHGLGPTSALQVRRLEGPDRLERSPGRVARHHPGPARTGHWGVAVLTRFPVVGAAPLDLGQLRHDKPRRLVAVVDLEVEGRPVTVVGAHMAHLSAGSPRHFLALRRHLYAHRPAAPGDPERAVVVAGDMNLWGPPTAALLSPWRRAVRGRTWPSWRPIAQPDHILVNAAFDVLDGRVVHEATGSDHLPVRARLALDGAGPT